VVSRSWCAPSCLLNPSTHWRMFAQYYGVEHSTLILITLEGSCLCLLV
jgi:hypothetical protein